MRYRLPTYLPCCLAVMSFNVGGNVTVNANAVGNVDADVGAVSLSLIGTAGSASARSDWDANVRAAIGADTNLLSGGDVLVQAQSNAAFITATAESTGAALGASVTGTSAFVDVFSISRCIYCFRC